MKRFQSLLLVLSLLWMTPATLHAQHPRLFLTDSDLTTLGSRLVEGEEAVTLLHTLVMAQADEALQGSAPVYAFDESGLRLLHQSRAAIRRIAACSYAWRSTQRTDYLECALSDLRTVCSFPDWNGDRHFLDAAEMALAVAVGCDWLWNQVPADLLDACRKAVQRYAFTPALRPHWFYTSNGNWNQVCNSGLVAAALSLWERGADGTADRIVARAIETNRTPMAAIYSPDGAYPEGPVYWNYGTMFEALMLTLLHDICDNDGGLAITPGFSQTPLFEMFTVGSSGMNFNYADNLSRDYCASALWFFAWWQQNPSLLGHEMEVLRRGDYVNIENERFLPFQLCYAARMALPDDLPSPAETYYCGHGVTPVVIIRTGWDNPSRDRYLGFKGGSAGHSHGHMDAGSFVYDAYGCRWIMDPDRQEYAPLEVLMAREHGSLFDLSQRSLRWKLLRFRSESHSTLTINGAPHRVGGSAVITKEHAPQGKAVRSTNGGDVSNGSASSRASKVGATMDLTSVFEGEAAHVSRTLLLVKDKYVQVIDTVTALNDKPAAIRFTLPTPATVKKTCKGLTLRQQGHKMTLRTKTSIVSSALSSNNGKANKRLIKPTCQLFSNDPKDYPDSPFMNDETPLDATLCGFTAIVPEATTVVYITTLR